jgi:hypothetical protein
MTRLIAILCCIAIALGARAQGADPGAVRVAMLTYDGGRTAVCFSTLFLQLVGYETEIEIDPSLHPVALDDEALFDHPFAIMSGEGAFSLSTGEVENLRAYLARGGFLLASPSCSNPAWGASFQRALDQALPEATPGVVRTLLTPEHEVFRTVYDLPTLSTTDLTPPILVGVEIDGRLAVVYSPQGLNDTETAGGGCCCCGTSEIREARFLNANMLVYALLQ